LNRAGQKAYYRFLHNEKASEVKLVKESQARCSRQVKGKVVLSIQDMTEINLSAHKGKLKEDSGFGALTIVRVLALNCIHHLLQMHKAVSHWGFPV
jgi:hypothetical protein